MAKESSSAVSLLAALVVTVTGLIPVVWLLTSPAEQSVVETEVVVEQSTTTTSAEVTQAIVEPIPELEVEELDASVVRVLQANGYAELAGELDLEGELPDAVTRLLIEKGAVLTIVEDDPTAEEG